MAKQLILICSALAVFLSSCSQDEINFDGPALVDIYGDFFVINPLEINTNSVDFASAESVVFSAEFSKNVNWKIEISGLNSGAKKSIIGFSKSINASNANWDGSISALPMFGQESCAIELTIENEIDTLADTIEIVTPKIINGLLLSDFETGWNAGWSSFVQSGADMSFIITDEVAAGQGNKYYDMGGAVDWDYLIGLIDIPATAYGAPTFALSSNPNIVYFNILLAKIPSLTNAIVLFQFREDDNEDGVYSDGIEDLFSLEVRLNGNDGWQLITSSYANLPTLDNGVPTEPIGNGVYEPQKLHMVSILMLANPVTGYSQTLMDLIIFTENEPLIP